MSEQIEHPDPNLVGTPNWICDACALDRGGVIFKGCVTVSYIPCGYCDGARQKKRVEYSTPTRDFFWPSQAERRPEMAKKLAERLADEYAIEKFPENEEARCCARFDHGKAILKGWGLWEEP